MDIEEILLRRLTGQHLIAPADKLSVARDLCGVQAQFMSNALHALRIRSSGLDGGTAADGLVKNWTLRGTVHVFAESDLPLFIRAGDYRKNEWSAPNWWNSRPDWALGPERQKYLSDVVLTALAEGPLTREELKAACRAEGMTPEEEQSMFHPWGGGVRQLCERGFMHYAASERKEFCLTPVFEPIPEHEAKLELAKRYFANYGPATIKDAAYFFGTTQTEVRRWLEALPVETAECGGRTYYYIKSEDNCGGDIPECIFLAGFDQLMLGYEKKESLFLSPEHLRSIFSLAGIVMPAVLLHGRVAGRWKRRGRKLSIELFSQTGEKDLAVIRESAESLWSDVSAVEFA